MVQYVKVGLLLLFFSAMPVYCQELGSQLPLWQEGMLDIHHINTGRGDAAFCVLPDGTTLLIDAGDMSETHARTLSARNAKAMPNNSKSAPEWIVDYIKQFHPKNSEAQLDYALITHYHDDHFGEIDSLRKRAKGGYLLTGIMEVGTLLPIRKLIDRGFDFPIDLKDTQVQAQKQFAADPYGMMATMKEYWNYIEYAKISSGLVNEALSVGSAHQISLSRNAAAYPEFSVQNIASNGVIWSGEGSKNYSLFSKGTYQGENPLSNCIRIDYGRFNYFTGGDIAGIDPLGQADMNSLESHVAPIIGAVDVATLNHHGNRDSQNPFYVRTVKPRVWVQQNWSSDHPGEEVLRRISSEKLYPGERDIFSTVMLQANKDVIGNRLDQYKSQNGHIVLRVHPKGDLYAVFILNDATEEREIIAKYGPYESR